VGRGKTDVLRTFTCCTCGQPEPDGAHREPVRRELGEPYRTLLGHVRHEIGHHDWSVPVARPRPEPEDDLAAIADGAVAP
jgi:Putative zinc-binding metallo-peptidase